ncbi:MAG: hypothetical protein NWT00_03115, partial [Beijerinckiaceae bacterium]|nr:hypothetical protein [Beijerinckiaceae bacterium]
VGQETWPTLTPEYVIIENNPSEGTFDLGVDSPSIVPGCTIAAGKTIPDTSPAICAISASAGARPMIFFCRWMRTA